MVSTPMPALIPIQICYANSAQQVVIDLSVPENCTILDAIGLSGLVQRIPEIDISTNRVGIFSKIKSLDTTLRSNDRIEIYRPLLADPKDSRRVRAKKSGKYYSK